MQGCLVKSLLHCCDADRFARMVALPFAVAPCMLTVTSNLELRTANCCSLLAPLERNERTKKDDVQVREYLEKNYSDLEGKEAVKLCVKALMELIEASGQTLELVVMEKDGLKMKSAEEVDELVKEVEADTAAADAARRSQAGQAPPPQQ